MAASFYSGMAGDSIVLKNSFPSVKAMEEAFSMGSLYTDVYFNEFVLIDCPNHNDKDHGKIFKRGIDYQNSNAGAIYVGSLVGPSSGTPFFVINTLEGAQEITFNNFKPEDSQYPGDVLKYPIDVVEDENGTIINFKYNTNEHAVDRDEKPAIMQFGVNNGGLVPGRYIDEDGNEQFNDSIRYNFLNIRSANETNDSTFNIGVELPYHVNDFITHQVSPYDENGNYSEEISDVRRIDDMAHPYYAKWDAGLPHGIQGSSFRNLRVIIPTEDDIIYDLAAYQILDSYPFYSLGESGYEGQEEDISGHREILVFDFYIYNEKKDPEPITFYLGDFNLIENISLEEDGSLTITYTHDDDSVFERKIKWITEVGLTTGNGEDGGKFHIRFNNGDSDYETELTWVKQIQIEEDGSVIYTFAGTDNGSKPSNGIVTQKELIRWITSLTLDEDGLFTVEDNHSSDQQPWYQTQLDWVKDIRLEENGKLHFIHTASPQDRLSDNIIKWITEIILDSETGIFEIDFNNGDHYESQLDWVKGIKIDSDTGNITIEHILDENTETLDGIFKLISSASISDIGELSFLTNTGEEIKVMESDDNTKVHQFKEIVNVDVSTDIKEDKKLKVTYNIDRDNPVEVGNPINYIQDMVVRPDDYHLLVLYGDPSRRFPQYSKWLSTPQLVNNVDQTTNLVWYNNVECGNSEYTADDIYWQDLGNIKDQAGLLIGLNVTRQDIINYYDANNIAGGEVVSITDYLNYRYPVGLTGGESGFGEIATKGKLVTYSNLITDEKEFYAFNYANPNLTPQVDGAGQWFYLGKLGASEFRDAYFVSEIPTVKEINAIAEDGLAFRISTIDISDTPIPKSWAASYNG